MDIPVDPSSRRATTGLPDDGDLAYCDGRVAEEAERSPTNGMEHLWSRADANRRK
jgi:hypothetical protein